MNVQLSIYRHRIEAADAMIEDWKANHDEAIKVATLEQVLPQLIQVSEILTGGIAEITVKFFKNESGIPDYNTRREMVKFVTDYLSILENALGDAKRFQTDYEVAGVESLVDSIAKLTNSVAVLKKTCPEPNKDMLARTAQNIRSGQVTPARELVHADDRTRRGA